MSPPPASGDDVKPHYGLLQLSKSTKIYSKVPKTTDNSSKTTVTYGKLNHRKLNPNPNPNPNPKSNPKPLTLNRIKLFMVRANFW